jgi:collagenase-like PrtC family protease
MRLSVSTNFDPGLIPRIKDYPVTDVFGKVTSDFVGGGRSAFMLPNVNRRRVEQHVAEAHKHGLAFTYLLNAACMDNMEYTRKGQREIRKILDWLAEIRVDAIVVSSPYLLKLIKRSYPSFAVKVSVFAQVDHVRKAQFWEELGADCITLDSLLVNREFELLSHIREKVTCDLQLLVNNNCLASCALSPNHMNALAHSSQSGHGLKGFTIDYCYLTCSSMKLREKVNYIRSEWIRPEDISVYEGIGYNYFKVIERNCPTDVLAKRVKAYAERRYDGNLLDLIQAFGHAETPENKNFYGSEVKRLLKFFFRPRQANPVRLAKVRRLTKMQGMLSLLRKDPPVYIDNRKLDGFINHFRNGGCKTKDCRECGYCHRVAEEVITVDPEHRRVCLELYDEIFDEMETGKFWRYRG